MEVAVAAPCTLRYYISRHSAAMSRQFSPNDRRARSSLHPLWSSMLQLHFCKDISEFVEWRPS